MISVGYHKNWNHKQQNTLSFVDPTHKGRGSDVDTWLVTVSLRMKTEYISSHNCARNLYLLYQIDLK